MTIHNKPLRAVANEDGAAILEAEKNRISTLNSTGAFVWQALQRGELAEAIADHLAQLTGAPFEMVSEDVAAFIQALKEHELLPL